MTAEPPSRMTRRMFVQTLVIGSIRSDNLSGECVRASALLRACLSASLRS